MKTNKWNRLNNGGLNFTQLGLGAAPLGNLGSAITNQQAHDTLAAGWDAGMRYFDTAPQYGLGNSERRVGQFLQTKNRDDFILATKVGRLLKLCPTDQRLGIGKWFDVPSRREHYDYTYDGVMRSVEFSLERTGLDRFDILFAHDLDEWTHGSIEARDHYIDEFMKGGYYALLSLRDQGVIKAFGAGLNEWQACKILAERGDMDLFLLAGRYTLLEQEPIDKLFPLCEDRGIGIVLGGAFNSGILATGAVEGAWYNYDPAPPHVMDRVKQIEEVCTNHNVRLIDAALQFPLAHPLVQTLIPGTKSSSEASSVIDLLNAPIPADFWNELKELGLLRKDVPVPGGE
ncbi:MAG: aldo/keto reductase [Rhizobiaceae bacterium]|nr:aldo/keto reductase [Rhizobiaceae bacterium]